MTLMCMTSHILGGIVQLSTHKIESADSFAEKKYLYNLSLSYNIVFPAGCSFYFLHRNKQDTLLAYFQNVPPVLLNDFDRFCLLGIKKKYLLLFSSFPLLPDPGVHSGA